MYFFLFILEILALASYILHPNLLSHLSREGGSPFIGVLSVFVLASLLGGFLYWVLRYYSNWIVLKTKESSYKFRTLVIFTLSPFLLLYFIFLQYVAFLKDIRPFLLPLSLIGCISLQGVLLTWLKRKHPNMIFVHKMWDALRLKHLSLKGLSLVVFLMTFLIYGFLASGLVLSPHPLTGDEPHYMLLTESILHDGDINLFNNYQEADYLKYYPGQLSSHALPGKKGITYQYSKHAPGLPILLLPFYFIGENVNAVILMVRLAICALTALLSLVFFLLVLDIVKNRCVSLLSWFVFSFCSPILFYSHLVYPEIPAALIMILLFRQTIYKERASASVFLKSGLGIAVLPWLGVKYTALSAILFLIMAFPLIKSIKKNGRQIILLVFFPLVSAGLYFFYLWSLYGVFSPLSIYRGVLSAGNLNPILTMNASFSEILRTGLAFFFDQRIGIFIYAPVYMLFIAGIIFSYKRTRTIAYSLLVIFISYWFFCSLFPYWWGYCPPGRPLLTIIWIAALFMAIALAENKSKYSATIKKITIAVSLLIVFLCSRDPMLLYHENLANPSIESGIYSHLLSAGSNAFINLRKIAPSLVGDKNIYWFPLVFWICAVLLLTTALMTNKREWRRDKSIIAKIGLNAGCYLLLSILFLGYQYFDIQLENRVPFPDKGYELIFQDTNHYGKELGGFWTKGNRRTGVLIRSLFPLSAIEVKLSSPVPGKTDVQVDRFKGTVHRSQETGQKRTIMVRSPVGFPWKEGYLYSVYIREFDSFVPFKRDRRTKDNRTLGVFVNITTYPVSRSDIKITR